MGRRPDVAELPEQDVVPVLHAAEAAHTHTRARVHTQVKVGRQELSVRVRVCDLLFGKVAGEPKLCVFLFVLQQLRHSVTQVK